MSIPYLPVYKLQKKNLKNDLLVHLPTLIEWCINIIQNIKPTIDLLIIICKYTHIIKMLINYKKHIQFVIQAGVAR